MSEKSVFSSDTPKPTLNFLAGGVSAPALRFVSRDGKPAAAISARAEQFSGQASLQFILYTDDPEQNWCEPLRVNGDEHPPEWPNSRYNRHARFQYGFYLPGISAPEQSSLEVHRQPGQSPFHLTSAKTDQPLMVLDQIGPAENGPPVVLVRNAAGPIFTIARSGEITAKGPCRLAGPVLIDAVPSGPKDAVTKAYLDNTVAALELQIADLQRQLREVRERLTAAMSPPGGSDSTPPANAS